MLHGGTCCCKCCCKKRSPVLLSQHITRWSLLACNCLYFVIHAIANASYYLSFKFVMHPSCELQQVLLLCNVLFKAEKAKQSWRWNGYPHPLEGLLRIAAMFVHVCNLFAAELCLLVALVICSGIQSSLKQHTVGFGKGKGKQLWPSKGQSRQAKEWHNPGQQQLLVAARHKKQCR